MLFQPPALDWIFNYKANNTHVTWQDFLHDVRHRFDPQSFRSAIGPLSKLVQTSFVAVYHTAFEKYLNRVEGLPEAALIPMFIAGLKESIQEKVELQQPSSLDEAMALALRLGASHDERRSRWNTRDSRTTTTIPPLPSGASSQRPSTKGRSASDRTSFRPVRVSNAEKAERSKQGLCYYCSEKWVPGHVCTTKMLSYLADEDVDSDNPYDEQPTDDTIMAEDLSHLRSVDGTAKSKPFRVLGTIGTTEVSILIDTGSSHDFLHPRIAEQLHLPLTPIRPFRVYVGNGASLFCSHMARQTRLILQGAEFTLNLHVLEIHGPT